jgi:hypothetical protein
MVLGAIAAADNLWEIGAGEPLRETLEHFELPSSRAQVAALAG